MKRSETSHFDNAIELDGGDSPVFTHTKKCLPNFINDILFLSSCQELEILTALIELDELLHVDRSLFISVQYRECLHYLYCTSAISSLVARERSISGFITILRKSSSLMFSSLSFCRLRHKYL